MSSNVSQHRPISNGATVAPSDSEVFEWLCAFESSLDLLRHRVDGWCVWPLLRKGIAQGISFDVRPKMPNRYAARAVAAAGDLFGLARIGPRTILARSAVSLLAERVGDRYKNVLVDDILLAAGDFVKIDAINSPRYRVQRKNALVPAVMSSSVIEVAAAAMARIAPVPGVREIAATLAAELNAEAGIHLPSDRIVRSIQSFVWLKRCYRLLVKRVRPRVVIVSTVGERSLCAAAREEGVPVVELQHGLLDRNNAGYAWTEYASEYRDTMPLPTHIFLFGEHWREELRAGGFWGEELRVVGSARMDAYRAVRRGDRPRKGKRVVWTTQGVDVARSIDFMAEFMRLSSDEDLELLVKLHPVYDRDPTPYRLRLGGDPRISIEMATEGNSTFEALVDADLHVSIYSTSHYDAIGLGVPTAILPLKRFEVVRLLADRGHADLVATPEQLAALVKGLEASVPTPEVREYYHRSDAVRNALAELARIAESPSGAEGRVPGRGHSRTQP